MYLVKYFSLWFELIHLPFLRYVALSVLLNSVFIAPKMN
jgi:hypothetical protein